MTSWNEPRRNVVFCCLFDSKYVKKKKQKRMEKREPREKKKRRREKKKRKGRKRKKSSFVIQFTYRSSTTSISSLSRSTLTLCSAVLSILHILIKFYPVDKITVRSCLTTRSPMTSTSLKDTR